MWIWTTYRKPNMETVSSGSPVVDMLHGGGQHRVKGFTDNPALVSLEDGIVAYEVDSIMSHAGGAIPGSVDFAYLWVDRWDQRDGGMMLDESLDSFAAKVGAPPRPRITVPAAFLQADDSLPPATGESSEHTEA